MHTLPIFVSIASIDFSNPSRYFPQELCAIPSRSRLIEQQDEVFANEFLQNLVRDGALEEALNLFQATAHRWDVISWSCLIAGNSRNGDSRAALSLLRSMLLHGVPPNKITLISAATAAAHSKIPAEGEFVHDLALQGGWIRDLALSSALLNMYGKYGLLDRMEAIFEQIEERNPISWTAVIAANTKSGDLPRALELFSAMLLDGVLPDAVALLTMANACSRMGSIQAARRIHRLIEESGFLLLLEAGSSPTGSFDRSRALMLANAIIDMYGECGSTSCARAAFDSMAMIRDDVSWNSMIGALARNGEAIKATVIFHRMLLDGIHPTKVTFLEILHAFSQSHSSLTAHRLIELVHGQIQSRGLECDALIAAGLIPALARINRLEEATRIFHGARDCHDVVLWTTIIAAYAQKDRPREAMAFFRRMLLEGFLANGYSIVAVLESCCSIADGILLESCAREMISRGRSSLPMAVIVENSLLSMFSRCGSIEDASRIFSGMDERQDTVSWNSMIVALSQHDRPGEALAIYRKMLLHGVRPEKITFVAALDACSKSSDASASANRAASLEICALILEAGHGSDTAVGAAMVAIHGKHGEFDRAMECMDGIHKKDIFAWSAMVSAYAQHERCVEAIAFFREMVLDGVEANDVIFVTVLSALGHAGSIEECCRYFGGLEVEFGMRPSLPHYGCVIDMLSRAGHLAEAVSVMEQMPSQDRVTWMSVLGGCRLYGDPQQGNKMARTLIGSNPDNASAYVALTNIYR
ncbi:pentatricopeptide repeat-containing protein At3g57430, chloroplastic [Selaginella moellendorffii]|uniref:pentatricopeptide repeat-containing protein At3g57430, chloroplastic n=1 Tax=Selaginella moellendorffii TaxID=88036 RepID=UPI000D1C3318|nr:pentatricopeptide repeat-containing protein At3g57430, chloroplastic [Selaginella moellendorffii]|eukprot:XP_024542465.1 pentatricopeptide repeat-containing protein At3g57430, chloroplastic [Selaginella moellendorffii]